MSDSTSSASGTSASQHARIIGRGLDRGGRVEVAADRLDLLGDLARACAACALECHVLEQMRDAVLVRPLVTAAGADPDAERGGLQMRHRVGHDHEAGGKTRDFDAHAAAPSCAARLTGRIWRLDRRSGRPAAGDALGPLIEVGEPFGQRRPHAAGRLDGIGEFGRVRGAEHDHRDRRIAGFLLGHRNATAVCGSTKWPVSRSMVRMRRRGLVLVRPVGGEACARIAESARRREREPPRLGERAPSARAPPAVAAIDVEQQPLEIRRDLDVHRRRGGRHHLAQAHRCRWRSCARGCR